MIINVIQRSVIHLHAQYNYIYTWHISPCSPYPLLVPLCSPLCPFLLTWHPPVVIGIVHLPLRLLVN
jgi:hypothetical protein